MHYIWNTHHFKIFENLSMCVMHCTEMRGVHRTFPSTIVVSSFIFCLRSSWRWCEQWPISISLSLASSPPPPARHRLVLRAFIHGIADKLLRRHTATSYIVATTTTDPADIQYRINNKTMHISLESYNPTCMRFIYLPCTALQLQRIRIYLLS